MAELVLWIEEKGQRAADEPSREPSKVLQQLRQHEAAERELLATLGHVEGLQQVGAQARGCRAYSSSNSQPWCMVCFHGTNSLKEESFFIISELGSHRLLLHSAGYPSALVPKQPRMFPLALPSPHLPPALSAVPVPAAST